MSRTDVLQPLRQAIVAGELSRREAVQLAIAAGVSLTAASQALSNPMSAVRVRSTSTTAAPRQTFDYIIVGSGTAGCVLAHRLSADRNLRILVLEAGAWPTDPAIDSPQAWPGLQGRAFDWGYSKPFCVLWGAVSDGSLVNCGGIKRSFPRGAIIIYREFYGCTGKANEGLKMHAGDIAKNTKEMQQGEKMDNMVADPAIFDVSSGESIAEQMSKEKVMEAYAEASEDKATAYDYYENVQVAHQPMMCQHCDNAPCETVCPVLATTHSSEGLNQMTYNRCIGTKYCGNNCPYKVRRFNWFRYNENEKFDYHFSNDLGKMVINPDVTVRSRGVMEKCSFCVQRIQATKLVAKRENRKMNTDEFTTACAQTCPSNAIVFGDLNDANSEIAKLYRDDRSYHVLEELGVKPSVQYLTKIRNK